jgi:hypothetical protein
VYLTWTTSPVSACRRSPFRDRKAERSPGTPKGPGHSPRSPPTRGNQTMLIVSL